MNNDFDVSGFLKVTVLSGIFLFPIEDAKVTISSDEIDNSDVITTVYTDKSGSTGPIPLAAYDENYNIPQTPIRPVKIYNVTVTKDGYSKVIAQSVPIFPNIVSEKFVYMVPLPEMLGAPYSDFENTIYTTDINEMVGGEEN